MAKALTPKNGKDGSTRKDHNASDIKKLLKNCAGEAARIKGERKVLNEEMADIRQRVDEAGIAPKAFENAVRVAEMEVEGRSNYITSMQLTFEALGIGWEGPDDTGEDATA